MTGLRITLHLRALDVLTLVIWFVVGLLAVYRALGVWGLTVMCIIHVFVLFGKVSVAKTE